MCKAAALQGQLGRTGPSSHRSSTSLGGMELCWKEEWNGSTVELVKTKLTEMWALKLFPLHRRVKQGSFPHLGILHQAVFILGSRVQKYVPSSLFGME